VGIKSDVDFRMRLISKRIGPHIGFSIYRHYLVPPLVDLFSVLTKYNLMRLPQVFVPAMSSGSVYQLSRRKCIMYVLDIRDSSIDYCHSLPVVPVARA
jgi:hypothetical protein